MPVNQQQAGVKRRQWPMAWLLGLGVVITYFDRINLSVARDSLYSSFGLSLVGFGYLSSAFNWTYGAMQLPSGALLDRFGVKRVGRVSTFLWASATLVGALSPGMITLFASRMLLGVAESPTFPANAKAIGEWFAADQRSLPMAITDSAAKFSAAIGVPAIGLILLHWGWRRAFFITALISLIYSGLFFAFYRDPPSHDPVASPLVASSKEMHRNGEPLSVLLTRRKVWGLALGWTAYNYGFFVLLTWLPNYFSITLHFDLLHSSLYTSIPWLFAAAADLFVGGWLVDRLIRAGFRETRVRMTVLVVGMSFGLGIWGARQAHDLATALIWITLALCGLSAAAPVAWTVPSMIVPRGNVATVGAIANFCSQVGGISAPIATGYLVSKTQSFSAAFSAVTIVLLLGIFGYRVLLGEIAPEPESS